MPSPRTAGSAMRRLRGFTLIELIVVILILGILAAIAVIGYTQITDRANKTATLANAKQVATDLSAQAALVAAPTVDGYIAVDALDNGTADPSDDHPDPQAFLDDRYDFAATYAVGTVTIEGKTDADDVVIDTTGPVARVVTTAPAPAPGGGGSVPVSNISWEVDASRSGSTDTMYAWLAGFPAAASLDETTVVCDATNMPGGLTLVPDGPWSNEDARTVWFDLTWDGPVTDDPTRAYDCTVEVRNASAAIIESVSMSFTVGDGVLTSDPGAPVDLNLRWRVEGNDYYLVWDGSPAITELDLYRSDIYGVGLDFFPSLSGEMLLWTSPNPAWTVNVTGTDFYGRAINQTLALP